MTAPMLHVERSGAGPLLVLLHAVGLDGTFWGGLPARAAAAGHTVLAVDLPGHGRSAPADRPGRMDAVIEPVAAVIEAAAGGPAIVLGLSFGGMVAQNLALARPDLVAGLIACGCPGRMPEAAREAILDRGRAAEAGGMVAVVEPTVERWFTPDFRADGRVDAVRARLLADRPSDFAAAWEAIAGHDALDRLRAVRVPSLIVAGERDAATSAEASRALAEAIPGARLVVLPGAPHMMQIEAEGAFVDAVTAFLQELATSRGRS